MNKLGRGTFTATEQLPIHFDANGFYRDYLWGYLEGGIDECIPSVMLPALATRWQFVKEEYDQDVLYIGKGAPRRWSDPTAGSGFSVKGAATRFGRVDFAVNTTRQPTGVQATVGFTPAFTPGISVTPQLAVYLRSSNPELRLDPTR